MKSRNVFKTTREVKQPFHLEDYIQHLLTVMPERLVPDPEADIDDLLPWTDNMQQVFGTGD